jgi:hypothetical protein
MAGLASEAPGSDLGVSGGQRLAAAAVLAALAAALAAVEPARKQG